MQRVITLQFSLLADKSCNYVFTNYILLLLLLLYRRLKTVFSRREEVAEDRNIKDNLVLALWERGSHARKVHTGYLAYENSKSEARGRSRHKNNSKRVV